MEDVRRAAIEGLPRLFKVLICAFREQGYNTTEQFAPAQELFEHIVGSLLQVMETEIDKQTHAAAGEALAMCFRLCKEHCDKCPDIPVGVASGNLKVVVETLRDFIRNMVDTREKIMVEAEADEDFDEEAYVHREPREESEERGRGETDIAPSVCCCVVVEPIPMSMSLLAFLSFSSFSSRLPFLSSSPLLSGTRR